MSVSSCPRRIQIIFTGARLRTQVDPAQHGTVDLSLKQFKICAQRLSSTIASLTEESRLLERVYYKNKNQQRSSLFWRKVLELRRFISRMLELNLERFVEGLRYSFYDSENPKILRTPWTRVPDLSPLLSLSRFLLGIGHLLKQTNTRSSLGFGALIQQLKILSFAPLVLTMISIFSRFQYLTRQLQDDLQILWKSLNALIHGLYSHELEKKATKWLNSKPFDKDVGDEEKTIPKKTEESTHLAVDEDVGSRVLTPQNNTENVVATEVVPIPSTSLTLSQAPNPSSVVIPYAQGLNVAFEIPASSVKPRIEKGVPTKKRKKKRDEIDEIFNL